MMKEFWDQRYAGKEFVFGTSPNLFFREFIDSRKPGSILLPAEGEGRNAVYAAKKGWRVDAFDYSEVAREKALRLARENNVSINYWTQDIASFTAGKSYDAVGLIYIHLPEELRRAFHLQVCKSISQGGFLVFEAYAKEQIHFDSGGPRDLSLLYDAPSICNDFSLLHIISCAQRELELDEGPSHRGKAAVLRLIGQRL